VDNDGLFEVWAPYAELQTFTYHFGFHSLVAIFHWGTNLPLSQATLWTGQIINALAVLTLYPLAIRIGKNPWTGILTILLAGLLVPMPMFFVNWGRYTQLTGLAILPVSTYLLWNGYDDHDANKWRYALLIWLALGGLALTHYRVLVFALVFMLAYLLIYASKIQIKPLLIKSIIFCTGAGVLFLPWFINVFSGKILQMFGLQISTAASQVSTSTLQYNSIGELTTYLPALLWIAFILALGWGLLRRSRSIALLGVWWFLILLLANPRLFNLPGTGAINNFMVFISAYLPVCLIVSTAIIWIANDIQAYFKEVTEINVSIQKKKFIIPSLLFFLIIVTLIGVYSRLQDVHPAEYAMLTRPDKRAFNWLSANFPANSNFLVNSFSAYGGAAVVGSDGGWWLPLLTGFKSTQPPINYTMEAGPFPGYQLWVNELNAEIQAKGINHPDVVSMLDERKVTHIYIGQQQGQVGYAGPALNPDELIASPYYSMIYHEDRVWVFQCDF